MKTLVVFGLVSVLAVGLTVKGLHTRQQNVQQSITCGGWADRTDTSLSQENRELFYSAFGDKCEYEPKALLATQVVAGMNYKFLAAHVAQSQDDETYDVIVQIYAPLSGQPEVTSITRQQS